MNGPLSIRSHPLREELEATERASAHLALIHEADRLHMNTASGFSPAAAKLRVVKATKQLWQQSDSSLCLCCWIWLSNGKQYRAAWRVQSPSHGLKGVFERCEWPFKRVPSKATTLRRRSRGSA